MGRAGGDGLRAGAPAEDPTAPIFPVTLPLRLLFVGPKTRLVMACAHVLLGPGAKKPGSRGGSLKTETGGAWAGARACADRLVPGLPPGVAGPLLPLLLLVCSVAFEGPMLTGAQTTCRHGKA